MNEIRRNEMFHLVESTEVVTPHDEMARTLQWFMAVGGPLPDESEWKHFKFNEDKWQNVQLACFIEEAIELIESIDASMEVNRKSKDTILCGNRKITVTAEVLDGIGDVIVTAIGLAYRLGYDPIKLLGKINDSNFSKFDNDGKPIFNMSGKVVKGPSYRPPVIHLDELKLPS